MSEILNSFENLKSENIINKWESIFSLDFYKPKNKRNLSFALEFASMYVLNEEGFNKNLSILILPVVTRLFLRDELKGDIELEKIFSNTVQIIKMFEKTYLESKEEFEKKYAEEISKVDIDAEIVYAFCENYKFNF